MRSDAARGTAPHRRAAPRTPLEARESGAVGAALLGGTALATARRAAVRCSDRLERTFSHSSSMRHFLALGTHATHVVPGEVKPTTVLPNGGLEQHASSPFSLEVRYGQFSGAVHSAEESSAFNRYFDSADGSFGSGESLGSGEFSSGSGMDNTESLSGNIGSEDRGYGSGDSSSTSGDSYSGAESRSSGSQHPDDGNPGS
eukprot:6187763-Pleurochrysis_carterae.AAC.1